MEPNWKPPRKNARQEALCRICAHGTSQQDQPARGKARLARCLYRISLRSRDRLGWHTIPTSNKRRPLVTTLLIVAPIVHSHSAPPDFFDKRKNSS